MFFEGWVSAEHQSHPPPTSRCRRRRLATAPLLAGACGYRRPISTSPSSAAAFPAPMPPGGYGRKSRICAFACSRRASASAAVCIRWRSRKRRISSPRPAACASSRHTRACQRPGGPARYLRRALSHRPGSQPRASARKELSRKPISPPDAAPASPTACPTRTRRPPPITSAARDRGRPAGRACAARRPTGGRFAPGYKLPLQGRALRNWKNRDLLRAGMSSEELALTEDSFGL